MSDKEFDRFAQSYNKILLNSFPASTVEDEYFSEYKIRYIEKKFAGKPSKILDFGCGIGRSFPWLKKYFQESELWGYDPSDLSLRAAKAVYPKVTLLNQLEKLPTARFDVILAANVFHHISKRDRLIALEQCRNMLTDNGTLFIFEHNPINPLTRWVFEHCVFDKDAEMIPARDILSMGEKCGFSQINLEYTLFFPRQLSILRPFEQWISKIPLGAQYCVRLGL